MSAEIQIKSPNRRQVAKQQSRQRILNAARELFISAGFHATTIRAIAAKAGLSTGAIFASFNDKVEIYEAIYKHAPISPEQGAQLAASLRTAEAFIAGFEGDPMQDGVDLLLSQMRAALAEIRPAQSAPDLNQPLQAAA